MIWDCNIKEAPSVLTILSNGIFGHLPGAGRLDCRAGHVRLRCKASESGTLEVVLVGFIVNVRVRLCHWQLRIRWPRRFGTILNLDTAEPGDGVTPNQHCLRCLLRWFYGGPRLGPLGCLRYVSSDLLRITSIGIRGVVTICLYYIGRSRTIWCGPYVILSKNYEYNCSKQRNYHGNNLLNMLAPFQIWYHYALVFNKCYKWFLNMIALSWGQ